MAETSQPATPLPTSSSTSQLRVEIPRAFLDIKWPLLAYLIASFATRAYFMGDTRDYADSIVARSVGRDYYFWEFGHVIWRPLGYLVFLISEPITPYFVGADALVQATLVLLVLSWLSGLLSVLSLHWILKRICRKRWVVLTTTIAFILTLSFLNYFHSGAPYVPGLSMVLLALCLMNTGKPDEPIGLTRSMAAALALAGAVCIWFPYVVVTPAVVLSAGILQGFDKRRLTIAIRTLMVAGALTLAVYVAVAWHIGVFTPAGFKAWVLMTSGDAASTPNKGISKTIFGFARAFVSMENDGVLFKRYLLHDPFNPITFFDLVRLSFWKILGFYLFLLAIILSLLSFSRGRRVLALLAVAGMPVLAFAIYWQGGDPERYLPLFPFLMLAVAVSLDETTHRILRCIVLVFLIGASGINVALLATPRLNRQQESSAARVSALLPQLKSDSMVITANWQDDLINFNRTFPFNPVNRNQNLHIGSVITPGRSDPALWRQGFLKGAEAVWNKGGDVWLSQRLFAPRPKSEWNWVEGDSPGISWTDLYKLFSQLEVGPSVGGEDGFVLLLLSEQNKEILSRPAPDANP